MPDKSGQPGPKRILALSGGGVRGIVEVAFLEAVEDVYRDRYGPKTRLCDVFDLVGGTSTGALIATAVSLGHPMARIRNFYLTRAQQFFRTPKWYRFGTQPIFDCARLEAEFRKDVGVLRLGDAALRSYLAIVTKRLDTGSPWIVNNIPTAPYFDDPDDGSFVGNRHFELATLLRAATAAPTYFSPQVIEIVKGEPPGVFVDGGLSPHNDPSIALLMLARIARYGLCWPPGPDNLFLLSIGTGRFRQRYMPRSRLSRSPLGLGIAAMQGMMSDTDQYTLGLMEWLGTSQRPTRINSEVGVLSADNPGESPVLGFLKLDLPLEEEPLKAAGIARSEAALANLRRFADPGTIDPLYELAQSYVATIDLAGLLR